MECFLFWNSLTGDHPLGEYNLVIKDFVEEDAGRYSCGTDEGSNISSAEIIFVSGTNCFSNYSSNYEHNYLVCQVEFQGIFTPDIFWTDENGRHINGTLTATSNVIRATAHDPVINNVGYICHLLFETAPNTPIPDDDVHTTYDRSAPVYRDECRINAPSADFPRKVQIQIPLDGIKVGSRLLCFAEGPSSMKFTWTVNNEKFSRSVIGPILVVRQDMLGENDIICKATVYYRDKEQTAATSIGVLVTRRMNNETALGDNLDTNNNSNDGRIDNTAVLIAALVIVGSLLLLAAVSGSMYFIVRRRRQYREKAYPSDNTAYENVDIPSISRTFIDDQGEWEIPGASVLLRERLYSGDFGDWWNGDVQNYIYMGGPDVGMKMVQGKDREWWFETDDGKGKKKKKNMTTLHVIIKVLPEVCPLSQKLSLVREFGILKTLPSHANLVSVKGITTKDEPMMMMIENIPGTTLLDFLERKAASPTTIADGDQREEGVSRDDIYDFAIQVAQGMNYVQSYEVVHRCLRANNIILTHRKVCKLCDFEYSSYEGKQEEDVWENNPLLVRWMPPERSYRKRHTSMSDVWSYGILLSELVTSGVLPYKGMNVKEVQQNLLEGYRMPRPKRCGEDFYDVMYECWREEPEERPTFAELGQALTSLKQYKPSSLPKGNSGEVPNGAARENR